MFGLSVPELIIILAILGVVFIPTIFYVLTLQKALFRCSLDNRTMAPGLVWLLLIPIFNLVWHFFIVLNMANSLEKELEQRGIPIISKPGKSIGLATCILSVLSFIPIAGILLGIAAFVCWVIYWVKIADYSSQIAKSNGPMENNIHR